MQLFTIEQLSRKLGRTLLASSFVRYGLDCARDPGDERVEAAARLGLPAAETMVRLNGAAMAISGTLVAMNVVPRRAVAALAALLVPTTVAGHAYWRHEDPVARAGDEIHFYKNLSLIGALVVLCAHPAGEASTPPPTP